jgi:hypothetical protein
MVVDVVAAELDRVHDRIAGRFARAEPRAGVREYLSGLVAGLERKNGWLLVSLIQRHAPDHEIVWSWSRWCRRRQYRARQCHYRHRGYLLT